jgi:hypothetical protein
MLWKLNFITIWVLNSITELEQKIGNKNTYVEAITHRLKTTPYPRGADFRNGSHREGGRERTHLQDNIKVKPEQVKLGKTALSMWS